MAWLVKEESMKGGVHQNKLSTPEKVEDRLAKAMAGFEQLQAANDNLKMPIPANYNTPETVEIPYTSRLDALRAALAKASEAPEELIVVSEPVTEAGVQNDLVANSDIPKSETVRETTKHTNQNPLDTFTLMTIEGFLGSQIPEIKTLGLFLEHLSKQKIADVKITELTDKVKAEIDRQMELASVYNEQAGNIRAEAVRLDDALLMEVSKTLIAKAEERQIRSEKMSDELVSKIAELQSEVAPRLESSEEVISSMRTIQNIKYRTESIRAGLTYNAQTPTIYAAAFTKAANDNVGRGFIEAMSKKAA